MIVTPAVDLKGGRCVQLVGGRIESERISRPDPVAEAIGWHELGFDTLHVVDLDAALGVGDNRAVIDELIAATPAAVQVGGGVRSKDRVESLLGAGAVRVIVGTRALDDPAWLEEIARLHLGRITVALDTRDGGVLRKGWTESTGVTVAEYLSALSELPLAGVLTTDVAREGRLGGIDRDGCRRVIDASAHPTWISGGVTTIEEIEFLEAAGAEGVVLGMAIYTDTLNRNEVAARWGRAKDG